MRTMTELASPLYTDEEEIFADLYWQITMTEELEGDLIERKAHLIMDNPELFPDYF